MAILKSFNQQTQQWEITSLGQQGPIGPIGKSPYEVAVDEGFIGTAQEWLASLNGDGWVSTGEKTANYTAAQNESIPCNTAGGSFTVTLPSAGGRVWLYDSAGNAEDEGFGVNSLFVAPGSGRTVMGDSTLEIDVGASSVVLELVGADWRIVGGTTTAVSIDPTVVAGSTIIDGSVSAAKLDAQVNESLDKADSALQYTSSPLILPNNSRINGTEHFYQTAKPTVRGDGSALVIGDRWWKTDTGEEWFWNGSYWLGQKIHGVGGVLNGPSGVTPILSITNTLSSLVFVEYINWFGLTGAVHDASNYFKLRFYGYSTNGGFNFRPFFADTASIGASSFYSLVYSNIVLDLSTGGVLIGLGLSFFTQGSPATSGVSTNLSWHVREIA